MIKFFENSHDPMVFLPENLLLTDDFSGCPHFLSSNTYLKGWRQLCPHIFQDVQDEVFEFSLCLMGMLANPIACGLNGCAIKQEKDKTISHDV